MMTTDPQAEVLTIHECMGRILAELPAIGKDQYNTEQKFHFRGVDDVLNALNPLLGKYGAYYVPDVIERIAERRSTRSGGTMYEVNLHVRFTFYGPGGDSVTGSSWGEGTDMGDKATNKAMTGALKSMIVQAFSVSTKEQADNDQDRHTDEETMLLPAASIEQVQQLRDRLAATLAANEGHYPPPWTAASNPLRAKVETLDGILAGDAPPPLAETIGPALAILDAWDAAQMGDELGPCSKCGSTRTKRVVHEGAVVCEIVKACDDRAARLLGDVARPDITDEMILSNPADLTPEQRAAVEEAFAGPDAAAMEARAQALLAPPVDPGQGTLA